MLFFTSLPHKGRRLPPLHCLAAVLMVTLAGLFIMGISPRFSMAQEPQRPQIGEYELKAVYLYNFFHFVIWPDNPKPDALTPKIIGVVGQSPFGDALKVLQDKLDHRANKNIKINYYGPFVEEMNLSSCHLLFISSSEKENFTKITSSLKGIPVLTVADSDDFLLAGGMINMLSLGNRVRWSINRTAVKNAGLRMHAKLLDIALEVVEHP